MMIKPEAMSNKARFFMHYLLEYGFTWTLQHVHQIIFIAFSINNLLFLEVSNHVF